MVVLLHTLINIYNRHDCDFPQFLNYIVVVYALSLILLFSNFFYQAYVVRKHRSDARDVREKPSSVVTNGVSSDYALRKRSLGKQHFSNGDCNH